MKKGNVKRIMSGFLATLTILTSLAQPVPVIAAESRIPSYEEVMNQLDADEVVTARNHEIYVGTQFDITCDLSGIDIPDPNKVRVKFQQAMNENGDTFSTDHADEYEAIYYVEPQTTNHPTYQVSRTISVREQENAALETVSETAVAGETDQDTGGGTVEEDSGEDEDSDIETPVETEAYSETDQGMTEDIPGDVNGEADEAIADETSGETEEITEEFTEETEDADEEETEESTEDIPDEANDSDVVPDTTDVTTDDLSPTEDPINNDPSDDYESVEEPGQGGLDLDGADELTDFEFDEMIEASEGQITADPITGITLSDIMETAVEDGVDLLDMAIEETVTFEMPVMLSSGTGTQSVTITRGSWYYYADYGLGSYYTAPYYVKWGDISATAYCVQPSKSGPDDGAYTITKLSDSKTLAKVCYYGTKASDENGFFDEKHPGFSAGKKFIITHIAAAYANGSSDWDSGTNATGRSLAMELYNYCVSMPEIPDVEMSFSEDDVKAYIEGNVQRTREIKFKADALQTITFKLPAGVKLVNVTTGKTSAAGAEVEISGGTTFYLKAPLTQANDVNAVFSTKMRGSIDKEFSAYKIATGSSTQDLALVFGEGVGNEKYINFKVTWVQECGIAIVKKDQDTGATLAGAIYGVYSDEACTKLISKMPATDANGASKVTFEKTQDTVYLKEISVPAGYLLDTKVYKVSLTIGQTATKNVTDKRVKAAIKLTKQDAETAGTAQGDASLANAVYGLYAREDIVHPDGKTGVIYKAGSLITSLKTDKNGAASVSDLYLGKYYIKEITAPTGYLVDQKEYDLNCSYESATVEVVERSLIVKDGVVKQPFCVIKAANNGKTNADLLKGVGFSAYLKSSLKTKADGSYDFNSAAAVVITADGKTEMFTDAKGYACSIPLPFGTYIVRETTSLHNYDVVDDFEVVISENKPDTPQVWRVLLDKEFKAKLKIVKKDDETKKPVLVAGAEFKVYDLDNEKYIEQVTTYPKTTVHKSFKTDENGYLILPESLRPGNYRIEEINAPKGYTLNSNFVNVTVDTNTAFLEDAVSGDAIITVEYENHPVKGQLIISKQGEVLKGFDGDFLYEMAGLAGAEFEIYAAENIYTADHQVDEDGNRQLYFAKDALVAKVATDAEGKAVVKNLPLGSYYVKETKAAEGFVLSTVPENVDFAYADQNTPVVEVQKAFTNERQKVAITVEKQDAETEQTVEGAVFGIYNAEDILDRDGKVLVKAGTLLQEMTSDADGQAVCTLELPNGSYYVKEIKAPTGYVSSEEILTFDAAYQGQEIPKIELKAVLKNAPTTVEITKADVTTGVELSGAHLTVTDSEGNVIDTWDSEKDAPHVIKKLHVGETYTLREELAPYGYLAASEIQFIISDTAQVQKVQMTDEVPIAKLIINKKGEFLDSVSLTQKLKGTVEHLFHYITGSLTDVTFEVYAKEDIKAADGVSEDYYKADELVATITTDDTGVAVLENLPLGIYYVKEVGTAYGYVLDGEPIVVDLTYRDQNTPVVIYDEDWQNNRQTVKINILKKEKNGSRVLEGGIFGLFAKEEIKSAFGKVLIEKDEIIELKTTDAKGEIHFIADLPMDAKYYVKEMYAPAGFANAEEVQEFTFEYAGDDQEMVEYSFTFEDEPTTVEITKSDLTNGKEIPGCKLQVTDEDGKVVDEWISTNQPHVIQELVVGKTYTLTETKPADGYVTAESIEFVIENTSEVQKIEMKDDVTKVEISKQDIAGKELPGAKLTILDENGNVMETWTSTDKPHYIEMLPIGSYVLREETAPEGYLVANEVKFEVKDTGEVQHVQMVDEAQPTTPENPENPETPETPSTPRTGDDRNVLIWYVLLLVGAGGLGGAFALRRKKSK